MSRKRFEFSFMVVKVDELFGRFYFPVTVVINTHTPKVKSSGSRVCVRMREHVWTYSLTVPPLTIRLSFV